MEVQNGWTFSPYLFWCGTVKFEGFVLLGGKFENNKIKVFLVVYEEYLQHSGNSVFGSWNLKNAVARRK